eukprot:TRINITY_DN47221_c0_g1_i1.p1 TRINITY_DN47221_c0_g1~~TRINITY_DN47221_c0_g1_i1.p1  ORF type:complete len:109 (-),score=17.65 TRINITY_DN47221_c0_g1_i1:373-699(-)
MKDFMKAYEDPASQDATAAAHRKVEKLKDTILDARERLLDTHGAIEALERSAADLHTHADEFRRVTTQQRRQTQCRSFWQKFKIYIIGAAVVVILILILCLIFRVIRF